MQWKKKVFTANKNKLQLAQASYTKTLSNTILDLLSFILQNKSKCVTMDTNSQTNFDLLKKGSCVFTSAHYGNFEEMCSFLTTHNVALQGSYIPLKSKFWNSVLLKLRKRSGYVTSTPQNFKSIKNNLSKGMVYGLMMDQFAPKGTICKLGDQVILANKIPLLLNQKKFPIFFGLWIPYKNFVEFKIIKCHKDPYQEIFNILWEQVQKNPNSWHTLFHKLLKSSPEIYQQ
jgi:lauroyl/myristoyl acyltransferase